VTGTKKGEDETKLEHPHQAAGIEAPEERGLLVPFYILIVAISMAGWLFALFAIAATAVRRLFN